MISRILALRDFSSLNELEDFNEEELALLNEKFNLRFSETSSGYKCFFSSKIGKAGIAESKIKAFTFMLDNFQFKPDLEKDILPQLEAHLNLIPQL